MEIKGNVKPTSITIGANTLDTNEWAFLDGQDQAVKTSSSVQHAYLGVGVAASSGNVLIKSSYDGAPQWRNQGYSDTPTAYPAWTMYRSRGTAASPAALQSGDYLGAMLFYGADDAAHWHARAGIYGIVDETVDGVTHALPSALSFWTGSASTVERMRIGSDGVITSYIGIAPDANDGAYLGTSALGWSDLFLAEGGVINWDNGDATLTQTGNNVALAGASLQAPSLGIGMAPSGNTGVVLDSLVATGVSTVNTNNRMTDETVNNYGGYRVLVGTATASDTNVLGNTRWTITQATPSTLKSKFEVTVNTGDLVVAGLTLDSDQKLWIGSDIDTNIYRGAANQLKTDDTFRTPQIGLGADASGTDLANFAGYAKVTSIGQYDFGTNALAAIGSDVAFRFNKDGNYVNAQMWTFSDTSYHYPYFSFYRFRGTNSSPAAVQNDDYVGGFSFNAGESSTSWKSRASILCLIDGTVDDATDSVPMELVFSTGLTDITRKLAISPAGNVVCGNAALATNATDGFLYIPTCAGTPTGTPTAYTGRAAMVFDTTNNKLYVYDGGWVDVT